MKMTCMAIGKILLVFGLLLNLLSCASLVTRSADRNLARADRSLSMEFRNDIFDDFLWLSPPSYGKKLVFEGAAAHLDFAGHALAFTLVNNEVLALAEDGGLPVRALMSDSEDHYYNLDLLHWKTVLRWKHVSETHMVNEQVMVMVTEMQTSFRSVYDANSKSYHTETVQVPHMVPRWESRMVMKTFWVWRQVPVQVLDIPHYDSWRFTTNGGLKIMVYAVPQADGRAWYFQNLSYVQANDELKSIFGSKIAAKLILLDGNQDGFFDGDEDLLLYNTWNPYDQSSTPQEISSYSDNRWQSLQSLAEDSFLSFHVLPSHNRLQINNANSPFLASRKNGDIVISKLPPRALLTINGRHYRVDRKGVFDSAIQFGHYRLTLSEPGYFEWVLRFVVDAKHPFFKGEYSRPQPAATIELVNHGFRSWRLSAKDAQGAESAVSNENRLSLAAGDYSLELAGGESVFSKTLSVKTGEVWIYDFARDTLKLKTKDSDR